MLLKITEKIIQENVFEQKKKKPGLSQGAKKIIFTACHSGKLKLAFTSPDVISTSPQNFFWLAELISQFFCYSNSSKNLSDSTFFARW